MSILVYTENWDGKFKKLTHELLSYASSMASQANTNVVAVSIGSVSDETLQTFGKYGCSKVLNIQGEQYNHLDNQVYTAAIAEAAKKEDADVVLLANNFAGKALAPRLAVRLNGGLVTGVSGLPVSVDPFTVKKKVFSGNALSSVVVNAASKVLTLAQNSYEVNENPIDLSVEAYSPDSGSPKTSVLDVTKVTDKVLLTDAEIVVSGGRGMKSPDNWGPIEELAELLGAATACSRPVSDEHWRPHEEHVGQTGKIIAPNLYFACGISGAIQHLAGVSSSKVIVAINTDPDAPIFTAADYGIIGDVNKVLPEVVKAFQAVK